MSHPLVRTGQRYVIGGVIFIALVGLVTALLGPSFAPLLFACPVGAFFIWNGRALITSGAATPLMQQSMSFVTKGQLDEAEHLHAALPESLARKPMVARVVTVQRALIALMRGDAARAEAFATESIAVPSGFFTRDWDALYTIEARATRALARAAQGDAAKALEDIDAIEASEHAISTSLARASLARAIILARRGDKGALGAHLTAHGSLILEHVMPRERSLTRALRALARDPGKSVYREAARPSDESEDGRVRDWIGKVAPDAAGFAPRQVHVAAPDMPAPQADPDAMQTIATARAAAAKTIKKRGPARVLALWAVLVVMFLGIWQFLTPVDGATPTPAPASEVMSGVTTFLVVGAFAAFFAGLIAVSRMRVRHHQQRIFAADRDLALGRTGAGRKELVALATGPFPVLSAIARLRLANLANREGRFLDAMKEADIGFGLCNRTASVKAITNDLVAPRLLAERALALAALDRFAEAETELAQLVEAFPTFSLLASTTFRVRLVSAVRRKEIATASRIALSRTPEMPLDLQTDLLADVARRASGESMSMEESERITLELRAMPEVSAWVDLVAGDLTRLRIESPPATAETLDEGEGDDHAGHVAQA